jgi:hypothetical protein
MRRPLSKTSVFPSPILRKLTEPTSPRAALVPVLPPRVPVKPTAPI